MNSSCIPVRTHDRASELALWPTTSTAYPPPRNYSAIPQFILKHSIHAPDITSTLEIIYSHQIAIQIVRRIVSSPLRNTFSPSNDCRSPTYPEVLSVIVLRVRRGAPQSGRSGVGWLVSPMKLRKKEERRGKGGVATCTNKEPP